MAYLRFRGWMKTDFLEKFPRTGSARGIVEGILGTLALVLALSWGIYRIQTFGRASREPHWDDLAYLLAASDRLVILGSDGIFAVIASFVSEPPHSLSSVAIATLALAIAPEGVSLVYSSNAAVILGAIFLIFRLPELRVRFLETSLVSSLVFLGPVGFFLSDEFRPDPLYFLCVTLVLVLRLRQTISPSPSLIAWSYVVLGSLWFIKPSFFLVTAGLSAVVLLLDLDFKRLGQGQGVVKGAWIWLLMSTSAGLTVLQPAIGYVVTNTLGENSTVWVEGDRSILETFVVNAGVVSLRVFDWGTWVALIVGMAALVANARKGRIPVSWALLLAGFSVVYLLGMIATRSISVFFGMPIVFGVFFLGVTQALIFWSNQPATHADTRLSYVREKLLLSKWRRRLLVLSFIVPLIINAFAMPTSYSSNQDSEATRFLNDRIVQNIIEDCSDDEQCLLGLLNQEAPKVFVATISSIDAGVINWHFSQKQLSKGAVGVGFFPQDNVLTNPDLAGARYVVLSGERFFNANPTFRSNQLQVEWKAQLKRSRDWEILIDAEEFLVFNRVAP